MSQPPSKSLENVIDEVLHGSGPDLNDSEVARLTQFPVGEVSSLLLGKLKTSTDLREQSRAFDALMKIDGFDQVGFLVEILGECSDMGWRIAFCTALGTFPDPRAIGALCKVLQTDQDADTRFAAAESLGAIGDASAVATLVNTSQKDTGVDYEVWPISGAAERALGQIWARLGSNSD